MSPTPGIGLDTHASSGAGSYAIANENYIWLERMAGGVLAGFKLNPEPSLSSPADDGALYLIGDSPTGTDWSGNAGSLALWLNGAWIIKEVAAPGANGLRFTIAANAPGTDGTGTHPNRASEARYNSGAWTVDRLVASTAPTVNDDADSDYRLGSRWLDSTGDKEYVCTDSTVGAAVWVDLAGAGAGSGDPDQDLWATIVGDTGSTTANTTADSLTIQGNGSFGLSTSVSGDVVTITQDPAETDTTGALLAADFREFFLARYGSPSPICSQFGFSAEPSSPSDGDVVIVGDGTITGNGGGSNWTSLGLQPNDLVVWSAGGSRWCRIPAQHGLMVSLTSTATVAWGSTTYPIAFRGATLVFDGAYEDRWYPLTDVVTEQPYYTGKRGPLGNSIWRVYFFESGPNYVGTGAPFVQSYPIASHSPAFTWDTSHARAVTGTFERSGGSYTFPVILPVATLSVEASSAAVLVKSTMELDLSTYDMILRIEYTP